MLDQVINSLSRKTERIRKTLEQGRPNFLLGGQILEIEQSSWPEVFSLLLLHVFLHETIVSQVVNSDNENVFFWQFGFISEHVYHID